MSLLNALYHYFGTQKLNITIKLFFKFKLVGWLVVLRIYVALVVFQPYSDLEAGDNQSLKFKWRGGKTNPGPLAPQVKSLTTRPLLLLFFKFKTCYLTYTAYSKKFNISPSKGRLYLMCSQLLFYTDL